MKEVAPHVEKQDQGQQGPGLITLDNGKPLHQSTLVVIKGFAFMFAEGSVELNMPAGTFLTDFHQHPKTPGFMRATVMYNHGAIEVGKVVLHAIDIQSFFNNNWVKVKE